MELKCHGVCKELIDCGLHLKEKLIDCERRNTTVTQAVLNWNVTAAACFQENGFRYGIYWKAVNLTHDTNLPEKYIYSLFWGFQVIQVYKTVQLVCIGWHNVELLSYCQLFTTLKSKSARLVETKSQVTLSGRSYLPWLSSDWGFSFSRFLLVICRTSFSLSAAGKITPIVVEDV